MALMASTKALDFKVTRQKAELIPPAKPTPHEFKPLSDIDNHPTLHYQIPVLQFYRNNPYMKEADPVKIIRDAIARALVFYYPLAGRLRELHAARSKLVVECTGEGIVFIEADADVTLHQFGDDLHPPFPYLEELIYDAPGSSGIINCPLMLIQVTRLKCGGLIFGTRFSHAMTDGAGLVQFMSAVGELASGAESPSVPPVWERHLLTARVPAHVPVPTHHQHDVIIPFDADDKVHRSFFFGEIEIAALRSHLPPHLHRRCSAFQLITACLWRCRTIALSPDPNEEVAIKSVVNTRKLFTPPLPKGYYGNAIAAPAATALAGDLSRNTFQYAVELIGKSLADPSLITGQPGWDLGRSYLVSDLRHVGFDEVDYGWWGKPVYGGMGRGAHGNVPEMATYYISAQNKKGGKGRVVPVCLPTKAMEAFIKELETMMVKNKVEDNNPMPPARIASSL